MAPQPTLGSAPSDRTDPHRFEQPPLTRALVLHLGGAIVVTTAGPAIPRQRTASDPRPDGSPWPDWVRRGWPLAEAVRDWAAEPYRAPRTLIAIAVDGRQRRVAGAVALDPGGWREAARLGDPDAGYRVPVLLARAQGQDGFDHLGLRGRRIADGELEAAPVELALPPVRRPT
jgi:hypothetical protein